MANQSVIKPWVPTMLIGGLLGAVATSAILIFQMSHFEDARLKAEEEVAQSAQLKTEIATLQTAADTLIDVTNRLGPLVVDWGAKMKDKLDAETLLAGIASKQKQAETDLAQTESKLSGVLDNLTSAQKSRDSLQATISQMTIQLQTLSSSNIDLQSLLKQAADAEQRSIEASNEMESSEFRAKTADANEQQAQTNLAQLSQQMATLHQLKDALVTDQAEMTTAGASLKNDITDLKKSAAEAEAHLKDLKLKSQNEEDNLAAIRGSTQTLTGRQDELTRQVSELQATRDKLENDKKALESAIGALEAKIQQASGNSVTNTVK